MRPMPYIIGTGLLAGLFVAAPQAAEDGEGRDFEGSVEILYRAVSQDGSSEKYDEDFDGLSSGARLSSLSANWNRVDSSAVDFLRLEASGLGGDPYERTAFRMGRKDSYDFHIQHSKQARIYDLFDVVDDLDGSSWNSSRSLTDVDLNLHATDRIDVFFEFQEVRRDGTSVFMKDINADLFLLETPLDQTVKRYSVGGKFRLGKWDLLFRQTLRRHDYQFDNTTRSNSGLSSTDLATLSDYEWSQSDTGGADLTTLKLSVPFGDRVHLTATALGTLVGPEDIDSNVSLAAEGTSFRGTCSVTGLVCDRSTPCNAGIPGNVCVADPFSVTNGASTTEVEAEHLMLEGDLAVKIAPPLDFHLQMRSVNRDVDGSQLRDLDGNGIADDTEGTVGDTTPGSRTRVDYTLNTITGLFDWAPSSKVRVRAGYRTIDRELTRSGFEFGTTDYRNEDFDSDDDAIILGVVARPTGWVRLDADYEEGDVAQAFTAVAPMETNRLRVRARFKPQAEMRVDLGYSDHENTNSGADFRIAGACSAPGDDIDAGCWSSRIEGSSYSASFWHRANANLDYWFRWAQQDLESVVRARFDTQTVIFNSADNGDSIYDGTHQEWAAQVNFNWARPWRGFVRARVNGSEADNDLVGPTFSNDLVIDRDWSDVEVGLTYTFPSKLYLGGRCRVFDYDDGDDRLDYDGTILALVAGLDF